MAELKRWAKREDECGPHEAVPTLPGFLGSVRIARRAGTLVYEALALGASGDLADRRHRVFALRCSYSLLLPVSFPCRDCPRLIGGKKNRLLFLSSSDQRLTFSVACLARVRFRASSFPFRLRRSNRRQSHFRFPPDKKAHQAARANAAKAAWPIQPIGKQMKWPLILAHGQGLPGFVLIGFPALIAAGICLLTALCLKIFQSKEESPKARRWLALAGVLLALLGFVSPTLSPLIERVLK